MTALPRPPQLSSADVVLREWEERDRERLGVAAADPQLALHAGLDPDDEHSAERYIARQRLRRERALGYSFAIADVDGHRCQGQISAWLRDVAPDGATGYSEEPHGRVALAYWVMPDARGRGLAASAVNTLAPWLLQQRDIARLELFIDPANEASWRTAEHAGFLREGLLRSWQQLHHERRDVLVYSRLPDDPAPRSRGAVRRPAQTPGGER